jgi:hypothetical protein
MLAQKGWFAYAGAAARTVCDEQARDRGGWPGRHGNLLGAWKLHRIGVGQRV